MSQFTISKFPNYLKTSQLSQNVPTYNLKTAQISQNVPTYNFTISKRPSYLKICSATSRPRAQPLAELTKFKISRPTSSIDLKMYPQNQPKS